MYLVSIDEKVLPLPMGININKFSNYFSDGILFIDYLDDEEKNKVLSDLFDNISILFCSYDLNKYDFEKKKTIRNNINYARCMEKYFNEAPETAPVGRHFAQSLAGKGEAVLGRNY